MKITDKWLCDTLIKFPHQIISVQVPETSYSSSEGEEDFYDANDDPFASQVTTPTRWVHDILNL